MKSVLISIRPKWCELIASGEKTIEVRKTRPKIECPVKCYIYECNWKENTKWSFRHKGRLGKVIGEFVCDRIDRYNEEITSASSTENFCGWNDFDLDLACIHPDDLEKYASGKELYGWHISDLKIYDEPKELSEFQRCIIPPLKDDCRECQFYDAGEGCVGCGSYLPIKKPPQSWRYVDELQ